MIRVSNNFAKAMEFTSFMKKETVTDDELINAILKFETVLAKQSGVIFHCLVRNFKNEYANVLFVENVEHLHSLSKEIVSFQEAKDFFTLIEMDSVKMTFHTILKDKFAIPEGFACIEHGTFTLKDEATVEQLKMASDEMEQHYLKTNDNYLEHFIGNIKDKMVSEVAIGKTYANTKQICYGYLQDKYGQAFLNLANTETFDLDFWYLIA